MARRADAARVLAAAVHELSQPCASAMLAVDTGLELTARQHLAEAALRLEAAAGDLAFLLHRLRVLGRIASYEPTSTETADVAALVMAAIPGATITSPHEARIHPDIARTAVEETAAAIDAMPAATRVQRVDHSNMVEVCLVGNGDRTARLVYWCRLLALAGIAISLRRKAGRTLASVRMPAAGPRDGDGSPTPRISNDTSRR